MHNRHQPIANNGVINANFKSLLALAAPTTAKRGAHKRPSSGAVACSLVRLKLISVHLLSLIMKMTKSMSELNAGPQEP